MPPKVEPLPVTLYPSYPALEEEKKKKTFSIYDLFTTLDITWHNMYLFTISLFLPAA